MPNSTIRLDQLTGADAAAVGVLATGNGAAKADLSNVAGVSELALAAPPPAAPGQQDSPALRLTGASYDTAAHAADWRQVVDVTSNAGASTLRVQSRVDGAGWGERLSVSDAGAVTINCSDGAPDPWTVTKVQVVGEDGSSARIGIDCYGSPANPTFSGRRARGTKASKSAVQSGDVLAAIAGTGHGATGYASSSRVSINLGAAENWSDTAQGTRITFGTTSNGTTVANGRWGIEQNGHLQPIVAASYDLGATLFPVRDIYLHPSASLTPAANGDFTLQATSDTLVTIKYKGSDGVVRSVSLTLA